MTDDWAVRVTDDSIELAPDVAVHRMFPQPWGGGGYAIVRGGVIVNLIDGASDNLARLLDSVAADSPIPLRAWEAWRAHPNRIIV